MCANLSFSAPQTSPRRSASRKIRQLFDVFFVRSDFDTILRFFCSFRGGKTLIFACPRSVLEGFPFFDIFNSRSEFALILVRKRGQKSSKIVKQRIGKHVLCGLDFGIDFWSVFDGFGIHFGGPKTFPNHAKSKKLYNTTAQYHCAL